MLNRNLKYIKCSAYKRRCVEPSILSEKIDHGHGGVASTQSFKTNKNNF